MTKKVRPVSSLREMLLNRLEEVKRIGHLERRTDAIATDTTGVGISQDKLLEAFRSATAEKPFDLGGYAVPVTAGANHVGTSSQGKPVREIGRASLINEKGNMV